MPGKHAPKSSFSFYLSLARAAGGVVGAIVLVAVLTVVAFGGRDEKTSKAPLAQGTRTPTVKTLAPSPTPLVVPSPTPTIRAPSRVTVSVLNGTGRSGLAARTAAQVRDLGYKVKNVDNATATQVSTIYYQPAFEAEARALQEHFPQFTQVKPAGDTISRDAMLTMVIGKDYP
jgi:hypothetical protein